MANETCVWCEAYGESGRIAVASGPFALVGPVPTAAVGLRSPRVRRMRISRRSLGEASRDEVKSLRWSAVPTFEPPFHVSRMVASVGG